MSVSIGSFLGGLLTRKINMTPQNTMKVMMIFYAVNIASMTFGYFLGCEQPTLIGDSKNVLVAFCCYLFKEQRTFGEAFSFVVQI